MPLEEFPYIRAMQSMRTDSLSAIFFTGWKVARCNATADCRLKILFPQGDARLRLLRALLRRRTLQELIRSNPKLALSLHAARARLMLQGANAVTISLAPVEASVTSDTPAAAISEGKLPKTQHLRKAGLSRADLLRIRNPPA
jgi:hypothetical protein